MDDVVSVAERIRPSVIIIDTLTAFAEHAAPESGSSSAWARIMRPLVRLARDIDCAVVILHHARRSDGAYRDSSEIAAAVDVIAELSDRPGTLRRITYWGRYGRGKFAVRLVGHRFELAGDEEDTPDLSDSVFEFIRSHEGCSQRLVRDGVKGGTTDKRKAIDDLLDAGRIVNDGSDSHHQYRVVKADLAETQQECYQDHSETLPVQVVPSSRSTKFQGGGPVKGQSGPPVPNLEVGTGTAGPPVPLDGEGVDI